MPQSSKVCLGCRRDLPLDRYTRKKKGKYGRASRCKACRAEAKRAEASGIPCTCSYCGIPGHTAVGCPARLEGLPDADAATRLSCEILSDVRDPVEARVALSRWLRARFVTTA